MKLVGSVEVSNRLLPSFNVSKSRSQRASLSLGKQHGTEELFILHQSAQNKTGTMYKVKDNIEKVFTKYVNNGKATVRFKSPPHDLMINCDALILMGFLKMLKLGLENKVPVKKLMLSSLIPTGKVAPKPKTNMVIMAKGDYPLLKGFPRTLEVLQVNGIQQSRFDQRILSLHNLCVLDLKDNCLTSLPEALGSLTKLDTLLLSENQLGKGQPTDWLWMHGSKLACSLKMLDISHNQLVFLPGHLVKLQSLEHIKLDCNKLKKLPCGLGKLINLRYLSAYNNELSCLPGSATLLRLENIDVSNNPFQWVTEKPMTNIGGAPTLLECAARTIINSQLPYQLEDLPAVLLAYLDSAHFCYCGSACFLTHIKCRPKVDLYQISKNNTRMLSDEFVVPVEAFMCSIKCYNYFKGKL